MKTRTFSLLILILIANLSLINAQINKKDLIDPCLSKKSNDYMDRQQEALLREVGEVTDANLPGYPAPRIRQTALYLFDAVMHDKYVAYRKPVQEFFHKRIERAITDIENTQVDEGAKIWKLYNMGFVVKTKSVTIAFDIVRAVSSDSKDFELSTDKIKRIAKQCDVLFVSHKHDDHQDKSVAQIFLDAGKPVVAPDQFWKNDPIFSKITHLKREANKLQKLKIKNGKTKLKVVIYPGHQMAGTDVNVPLVLTPEGINIAHLGDQINEGDFMIDYDWIDNVAKNFHVDIMIPTNWTNELIRIAKGFNPELTIIGHEDELGHPVHDRDPFWGDTEHSEPSLVEFLNSGFPYLFMIWGESYHYIPKK